VTGTRTNLRSLARIWKHSRVRRLRVTLNPRLRSTLARWVAPTDVIQINPAVADRDKSAIPEVVCHEAAHLVVWDRHGRSARPHGLEWSALMRAAGFEPRATLVHCGQRQRPQTNMLRVRHVCPVCHFSKIAKRRMTQWRCPECRAIGLEGRLRAERLSIR
jgi:predicted SprT family Zn-dependent metalloprotease